MTIVIYAVDVCIIVVFFWGVPCFALPIYAILYLLKPNQDWGRNDFPKRFEKHILPTSVLGVGNNMITLQQYHQSNVAFWKIYENLPCKRCLGCWLYMVVWYLSYDIPMNRLWILMFFPHAGHFAKPLRHLGCGSLFHLFCGRHAQGGLVCGFLGHGRLAQPCLWDRRSAMGEDWHVGTLALPIWDNIYIYNIYNIYIYMPDWLVCHVFYFSCHIMWNQLPDFRQNGLNPPPKKSMNFWAGHWPGIYQDASIFCFKDHAASCSSGVQLVHQLDFFISFNPGISRNFWIVTQKWRVSASSWEFLASGQKVRVHGCFEPQVNYITIRVQVVSLKKELIELN